MLPATHLRSQSLARYPDRVQTTDRFTQYLAESPARARGCHTCANFLGRFYAKHLLCERNGGRQVIGTPRLGCAFWQREPGSDDE